MIRQLNTVWVPPSFPAFFAGKGGNEYHSFFAGSIGRGGRAGSGIPPLKSAELWWRTQGKNTSEAPSSRLKKRWKIAPAKHNTLNPNGLANDAEQENVVAHNRQPCALAALGPELIAQRLEANLVDLFPNFPNEAHGARRVVLRDIAGDGVQIALNLTGKLYAHSSRAPAASAIA